MHPVNGYEMVREDVEQPVRDFKVPYGDVDSKVVRQLFDYMQALGIVLGEEVIRVMSHTGRRRRRPGDHGRRALHPDRRAGEKQSPLTKTVYVTLANGKAASGYIPDDASYGHQTFQVLGSKAKPGCAEDRISDGIARLVSDQ